MDLHTLQEENLTQEEMDWSSLLPQEPESEPPLQPEEPLPRGRWGVLLTQLVLSALLLAAALVIPLLSPQVGDTLTATFTAAYDKEISFRALYQTVLEWVQGESAISQENAVFTMASLSEGECTDMAETCDTVSYYGDIAFAMPLTGIISSTFGSRTDPLSTDETEFHKGIDIAVPIGTSVSAAASGTVVTAQWSDSFGYYVVIDHGDGIFTRYGHCSKLLVSAGDKVIMGESIALSGSTGNSTGPHLHFEILQNGTPVDPLSVFSDA